VLSGLGKGAAMRRESKRDGEGVTKRAFLPLLPVYQLVYLHLSPLPHHSAPSPAASNDACSPL